MLTVYSSAGTWKVSSMRLAGGARPSSAASMSIIVFHSYSFQLHLSLRNFSHFRKAEFAMSSPQNINESVRAVLNVGGNSKAIEIPNCFDGWRHDLLDIDSSGNPDVLCDARELWKLPARTYDAVYCSHNLEHFYAHDVIKVLKGFRLALKKDGFAYIRVPDMLSVMKTMLEKGMDINDVLYQSPSGPIMISDVIYGFQRQIEQSGNDFYAHKTGFTEKSLLKTLGENGFPHVYSDACNYEIMALAFTDKPARWQIELLPIKQ